MFDACLVAPEVVAVDVAESHPHTRMHIRVIDSVFPLARAAEAHQRMESNESVGKIILAM